MPLETIVGWVANLNGNLGELLQEPSLMGAYEGAGITVLAKGVEIATGRDPSIRAAEAGAFPADTTLLTGVVSNPGGVDRCKAVPLPAMPKLSARMVPDGANRFPSNYMCNPSSIDGLSITNSSQGGGGIFVHGWAHNLQIANNRIYNNAGTLSGGISVGQGEFARTLHRGGGGTNRGSRLVLRRDGIRCQSARTRTCLQMHVNVTHTT